MSLLSRFRYMNPYDIHKALINEYVLRKPGDTKLVQRDTSKDKRDIDVLKEHHKFLWEQEDLPTTWEAQFAKKYYDKLFKEYCIGDLSLYKENKIAMRWRTEPEVINGKGQFICGNKRCTNEQDLRTWEVNFAYMEENIKKNALVKIRLCPDCSKKLNYHSKKREIKRLKHKPTKRRTSSKDHSRFSKSEEKDIPTASSSSSKEMETESESNMDVSSSDPWENANLSETTKTREEEMEEYLEDLLL